METKYNNYPSTEMEVVYENNHSHFDPDCKEGYLEDPIVVRGIDGKNIGFSWHYGDAIELDLYLNNTVLHADKDHIELFKLYLKDKEVEVNFTDMRGNVVYTFYTPASLHSLLKLNYSEDTMIKRNEYKCTLVLINPYDLSRINLLKEPYNIYVI